MTDWRRRAFSVALALGLGGGLLLTGDSAHAQGFGGLIEYTGAAGTIGSQRPLCLCVYSDAQLLGGLGCFIFRTNAVRYRIDSLGAEDYYLIVFVDVHVNEQLDPDEPFEIYHDRALPPADPIGGQSGAMDVDFIFADENLPVVVTPTPTVTPSATPSASPSASLPPTSTATPSPNATATPALPADCNGDGAVAINELVRGVAIALGTLGAGECPAADVDQDGAVTVAELIRAVNAALGHSAR
jgi:hypothetical protein